MARIKYSGLISDISGSLAGTTFQRGYFGQVLRKKPIPCNRQTAAQLNVRSIMQTVQQSWHALTPLQKSQWNRFIAYSMQTTRRTKTITLSGHALFLKYQTIRLLTGFSQLSTIAYAPLGDHPNVDGFEIDGGDLSIQFDDNVDHTDIFFLLKVSRPLDQNHYFKWNSLRLMVPAISTNDHYDFTSSYTQCFGNPPSDGDYVHYSLTWFSVIAPIIARPQVGISTVDEP